MKIFSLFILLFLYSCMPIEIAVSKHELGKSIISNVDLGNSYNNKIFYDLEKDSVVLLNSKFDWDLAFECSSNGNHIKLNSALYSKLYKIPNKNLKEIKDTIGFKPLFDACSGNLDSTAVGDWWSDTSVVYVLDVGLNEKGKSLGFYKFKI